LRIPKCASAVINYNLLVSKLPELKEYELSDDQIDVLSEEYLDNVSYQAKKIYQKDIKLFGYSEELRQFEFQVGKLQRE